MYEASPPPLHHSSAREVSCLTRILMTEAWLSSEATREPLRGQHSGAGPTSDLYIKEQHLTGLKTSLLKCNMPDTHKIYMLDMAGGEEV